MNAWEMAKLRRYYLHGGWDEAATLWQDIWDSWNTGLKPIPDPVETPLARSEDFSCSESYTAALQEHERLQTI